MTNQITFKMTFTQMMKQADIVLTEGSMIEVIRRAPNLQLDPFIANSGFIYHPESREQLARIYKGYIDLGQMHHLPFITFSPTWRANPHRLEQSVYRHKKTINRDCVQFLKEVVAGYGDYAQSVYVGGLMACKNDAYIPAEALSRTEAETFHRWQAQELAQSGVDFIKVATLPALSEAHGMAAAIAATGVPYILSFVIRPEGTLLDGTPLSEAFQVIDNDVQTAPIFYMVNCVHPSILARALDARADKEKITQRLWGFQGNTSAKSPEELNNLAYLDTSAPDEYAADVIELHRRYGLKVLGGCCGTDSRHVAQVAQGAQVARQCKS